MTDSIVGEDFQIRKDELVYTSCYCEENIWKLMESVKNKQCLAKVSIDKFYVVFISNNDRLVPIWCQAKSESEAHPVVWDYHVIAVLKGESGSTPSLVYDFDTTLKFPETFDSYVSKCLPVKPNIRSIYKREYKVIPAEYYLEHFASDRSHMLDKMTGEYLATPPKYPCIKSKQSSNSIDEFIQMHNSKHGTIMNEQTLRDFFKTI